MTSVINVHIVNVIAPTSDKKNSQGNQQYVGHLHQKDKALPDNSTIEVNPQQLVSSGQNCAVDNVRKVQSLADNQPEVLTCYPIRSESYVSKAYSSTSDLPKGTHIDTFV
jgi:hypothetical protein